MNKLIKSMSYAVIAQTVSLLVSVFMSFFVSKFMTVGGYGYYQLFLFYSTYVGLFQIGISEGVYLENGGKSYNDLRKDQLKQLFINALILELLLLAIICVGAFLATNDENKKIVVIYLALYAVANLFVMFFGLLLQAVNNTEHYSKSIIVGKVFTLGLFILLVFLRNFEFSLYCAIFLIGYVISGIIIVYKCRDILAYKVKMAFVLNERKETIVAGSSLLLSGLISSFIIGINRIYIEQFQGIEVFAKVSMALSLCNFVILFAIQVGMVMFPSVVALDDAEKSRLYIKLNSYTALLAPLVFIGYIPLRFILSLWIPQYVESIRWMLLFIPYMIYEIKTQVMFNTYIKALRKEKLLFGVNLIALLTTGAVNYILIKMSGSLEWVFWVIDIVMILKSVYLSRSIEKEYGLNISVKMIAEAVICCACSLMVYRSYSAAVIAGVIIIYIVYSGINMRKTQ